MDRNERIRQSFDKGMRLIEIGASYNPIVPKRDGWKTTVVDHASREALIGKYADHPAVREHPDTIEDVDVIWQDGTLSDAFTTFDRGTYDGLIASHVVEHIPDLVAFLRSVDLLLKRSGVFFLAVPDKRLCFDFFQPSSTTGNVLDGMGRERHTRGTVFDHAAYYAKRNGVDSWFAGEQGGDFTLAHKLEATLGILEYEGVGEYIDSHTWHFTPASFELVILELNALGLIPWRVATIEPQSNVEFFAWLERGEVAKTFVDQVRLQLLHKAIWETKEQVHQIEPEPVKTVEPDVEDEPELPTVSAIIPLYNGQRFIEEALLSVLNQSLMPKEIVVVDDGSHDDGPAIVQRLAAEYPIIKLLSKSNGGQSQARNFGVAHSSGDLIALLDQDDVWYPTHLEELVKPFAEPPPGRELGWVYSDLDEIDTEGFMINHNFLRTLPTPHPKRNIFECVRENMFILPSASLITRKAFDAVSGFDERLSGYEDDDLFVRLYRAGYANVFLEKALSKWRIYPDSYSYTYRMRRSRMIYFRKLWETFEDDPQRHRFIRRHNLVPRFYVDALAEFRKAVRSGKQQDIGETREELLFLVNKMPGWKNRVLARLLTKMESPRLLDMADAARPYLRPIIRRLV